MVNIAVKEIVVLMKLQKSGHRSDKCGAELGADSEPKCTFYYTTYGLVRLAICVFLRIDSLTFQVRSWSLLKVSTMRAVTVQWHAWNIIQHLIHAVNGLYRSVHGSRFARNKAV